MLSASAVPSAFDRVAQGYDRLVAASSRYHDQLRLSARRMGFRDHGRGLRLLDLGCGTGASTAALLEAAPRAKIIAVDASPGMLAEARAKKWPSSVRFVQARIEGLGAEVLRGPFDGVLAAHVLRDLADLDVGLRNVLRLLRPGAPLAVHDYAVAGSMTAQFRWTMTCWLAVIPAAWAITGTLELYRHYWLSVSRFDTRTAFEGRLRAAGFTDVRAQTMAGWQQGMLHTWLGRKPEPANGSRTTDISPD
jgi:ubiquinone/menaquinone biosynthesis C-methylase UbiE